MLKCIIKETCTPVEQVTCWNKKLLIVHSVNLQGNIERRVIARLASHKLLQPKVERFRKEHDDWESLAAFLLSKNTGRRFKKKTTKKVVARTSGATVDDKQTQQAVVDASDTSEPEETEPMDCVDQSDSSSTAERSVSPEMQIAKTECDSQQSPNASHDECMDSDDSVDEHVSVPCVMTKIMSTKPKCDKVMSKSITILNKASKTESRDSVAPARTLPQEVPADADLDLLEEKNSQVKSKLLTKTDTKTEISEATEMVVETLNLNEFHSEGDIVVKSGLSVDTAPGKDLSFLYTLGSEPSEEKTKKKLKDPFFMDESGSDEGDTSSDNPGSEVTARKTETQSLGRKVSKNMVQSSFIDTLSRPSSSRTTAKRER